MDRGRGFVFAVFGILLLLLSKAAGCCWGGRGKGNDDSVTLPGAPFNTDDSASLLGMVWEFFWENARMNSSDFDVILGEDVSVKLGTGVNASVMP